MSKGILAQWRRGIVTRGLTAAALLAVPVAVAATIGFGTSLSGLTDGLDALASGPDGTEAANAEAPEIDAAIPATGTATGGGEGAAQPAPVPGAPGGVGGEGGTPVEGTTPAPQGQAPATNTSPGGAGGGNSPAVNPPDVSVPSTGGGVGGAVDGLLDGVNNTANGLLGN